MTTDPLAQFLTAAVSPMLVISAAGLLLLSMTNRYARIIDRSRVYLTELAQMAAESKKADLGRRKVALGWRRAKLLRLAITLAIVSVFCVVLVVLGLFIHLLSDVQVVPFVLACFGASILTLGASLLVFLRDMTLSLHALEMEVKEVHERPPQPAP